MSYPPRTLYLAGPMTGLPQCNYPAFTAAAQHLRGLGYDVLNPAENTPPSCGTWAGWMRLALAQLVRADAVAFLSGWELSAGANREREVAHWLAMPCMRVEDVGPRRSVPFGNAAAGREAA